VNIEQSGYLPHVQGLRGLAVLAVVLYHAGLPLHGGYLGVDIFFVISGYVVTLSTKQQITDNRFSLGDFYSRRIRRLIPLLALVNVVTIALCLFFLSLFGEIQKGLSTVRWSSFFGANIQLLNENSYTKLTTNPFRHLWSLAVEEQFYFVYPIVVITAIQISKWTKKVAWDAWFGRLFLALFTASFVYYLLLTKNSLSESNLKYAFFSITPRFWEFAIGVLLAVYSRKLTNSFMRFTPVIKFLAAISLLIILSSLHSNHHLPRAILAIPVAATAGMILFGDTGRLGMFLASRPLTHLGDLSYGWYLWHWPLIVFTNIVYPGNVAAAIAVSIFALALSQFTYQRLEKPFRRNLKIRGAKAAAVLIGSILIVNISVVGANATGKLAREKLLPIDQVWGDSKNNVLEQCFLGEQYVTWVFNEPNTISELCSWPKKTSNRYPILAIGDSHMASYSGGLMTAASAIGNEITLYGAAGCPPIFAAPKASIQFCNRMSAAYINAIIAFRPSVIILSGRTSLYSSKVKAFDGKEMQVPFLDGTYPTDATDFIDSYIVQLDRTVAFAIKYGAKVIITLEPQHAQLSSQSLIQQYFPGLVGDPNSGSVGRSKMRELIRLKINERFSTNPEVQIFNPEDVLCADRNYCLAYQNGEPMYSDDNHISMSGSLLFTEKWKQILEKALTESG
jgi:peptidoglycan/LPS O-acetylase OafA/YrhL